MFGVPIKGEILSWQWGGPHFGCKEIYRGQDFCVRPDEFPPRHPLFAFRRWRQAVPLQNVGHGLMADFVSQIAQRADNPSVSPTSILRANCSTKSSIL